MSNANFPSESNRDSRLLTATAMPNQARKPQSIDAILPPHLKARQFDFHNPPPASVTRYALCGVTVSTPGNITVIAASAKGGKSAFIGAMNAAALSGGGEDCLGVTSSNETDGAVIYIDTEQSPRDLFDAVMLLVKKRAGLDAPPPWFLPYNFTGLSAEEMQRSLETLIRYAKANFGSIHSIFIDGAADFVNDTNDPRECNPIINTFQKYALDNNCSVVAVIHINPSPNGRQGGKTRGHMGSGLERKAESNIRLEKDGDAVVAFAEKNRKAPIPKENGSRFSWNRERGMHTLTKSVGVLKKEARKGDLENISKKIFAGKGEMKYGEIKTSFMEAQGVSVATAERAVRDMDKLSIIIKLSNGCYALSNSDNAK